jgi:N6-adenosine-specific RNA methylase IME4
MEPIQDDRRKYRTIVADPPWVKPDTGARTHTHNGGWDKGPNPMTGKASVTPYPQMDIADIAALPVAGLAEPDAHLYLWTFGPYIPDAYWIVEAWGFKPSALLTGCKEPMGLGFGGAFVPTTEHVLFARRGKDIRKARSDSTWFRFKRGEHSAKPEAFLDLVETVSPGPYLELFARRNRLGWDTWGNESLEMVEL